ncbi:hypothetical protein CCH79_00004858 [Gambusia affinis]|uniref:Ig-like domain-containing protein n=1 Tax=Gambusia affinis TaxID=33528 RepID=A0A315V6H2_GAMAF|nr:hypothetical protein CCH79_00004858 [Gambusia affinis]
MTQDGEIHQQLPAFQSISLVSERGTNWGGKRQHIWRHYTLDSQTFHDRWEIIAEESWDCPCLAYMGFMGVKSHFEELLCQYGVLILGGSSMFFGTTSRVVQAGLKSERVKLVEHGQAWAGNSAHLIHPQPLQHKAEMMKDATLPLVCTSEEFLTPLPEGGASEGGGEWVGYNGVHCADQPYRPCNGRRSTSPPPLALTPGTQETDRLSANAPVRTHILNRRLFLPSCPPGSAAQPFSPFWFTVEPQDTLAIRGNSALLNCSAHSDEASPARIEWKKDGTFMSLVSDERRRVLPDGSLFFTHVVHSKHNKPDEGTYQCVANIDNVGSISSRTARLAVAEWMCLFGLLCKSYLFSQLAGVQCKAELFQFLFVRSALLSDGTAAIGGSVRVSDDGMLDSINFRLDRAAACVPSRMPWKRWEVEMKENGSVASSVHSLMYSVCVSVQGKGGGKGGNYRAEDEERCAAALSRDTERDRSNENPRPKRRDSHSCSPTPPLPPNHQHARVPVYSNGIYVPVTVHKSAQISDVHVKKAILSTDLVYRRKGFEISLSVVREG